MERTLALAFWVVSWGSCGVGVADVYKYADAHGNIYFTDVELEGGQYRLLWHRHSRQLAAENRSSSAARLRIERAAPLPGVLRERRAVYAALISANARRYGLSPALLHAVIRAESAYDPRAVSPVGAQGLMQLMPATAARYGVADSFDPADNIRGGAAYLRDLLDLFDNDLRLALAGYNAGEGAVLKHGRDIPPYAETQAYVRKVLRYLGAERPVHVTISSVPGEGG
ncbi:lytic transglycosylase domain-containing protein [Marichromatium bheemlicum]|uniref:lytic transglycosylase domain-containing protein n=1 Tax=Marichromatium bheemlicum TaxID=365339 RepID=UPI0031B63DE7